MTPFKERRVPSAQLNGVAAWYSHIVPSGLLCGLVEGSDARPKLVPAGKM